MLNEIPLAEPANQVLTRQDILNEIDSQTTQIQSKLQINPGQALNILLKFKWNLDSLEESIQASSDKKEFLLENGLSSKTDFFRSNGECLICCSEELLYGLSCEHFACMTCWKTYIIGSLEDGNVLIECMDSTCKLSLCRDNLELIIGDSKLFTEYLINDYVENSSFLAWCPQSECELAVKRNRALGSPANCSCGHRFCFQCGETPHIPATCSQMQLWKKKRLNLPTTTNHESYEWILNNTKECPKCATSIQKNGGCPEMRCTNKGCRHRFCWMCLQKLNGHGIFCKKAFLKAEKKRLNSRADLHRFLHYVNLVKKNEEVKDQELLREARDTLIHSYVFGYYLKKDRFSRNLEKKQKDLKNALDKFDPKIQKSITEVEELRKSLLAHCAKGNAHIDLESQEGNGDSLKLHDVPKCDIHRLSVILLFFFVILLILNILCWVKHVIDIAF